MPSSSLRGREIYNGNSSAIILSVSYLPLLLRAKLVGSWNGWTSWFNSFAKRFEMLSYELDWICSAAVAWSEGGKMSILHQRGSHLSAGKSSNKIMKRTTSSSFKLCCQAPLETSRGVNIVIICTTRSHIKSHIFRGPSYFRFTQRLEKFCMISSWQTHNTNSKSEVYVNCSTYSQISLSHDFESLFRRIASFSLLLPQRLQAGNFWHIFGHKMWNGAILFSFWTPIIMSSREFRQPHTQSKHLTWHAFAHDSHTHPFTGILKDFF